MTPTPAATRETSPDSPLPALAATLLALALAVPFLWPFDPGASAKVVSMLIAAGLWSAALLSAAAAGLAPRRSLAGGAFAMLALVLVLQALGPLPAYPSQNLFGIALLLGAALVAGLGRTLAGHGAWLRIAAGALLAQALAQVAIGVVQFGLWQWPASGQWLNAHAPWFFELISFPGDGRIYGNLRQPNHYATAVALGLAGLAALAPRMRPRQVWLAAALLTWALVASASRTALVHVVALAVLVLLAVPGAWRSRAWRPLLAAPLLYAAWWLVLHAAASAGWISTVDALTRQLAQPVNARALIWRNAWQVIQVHPLLGWGWSQIGWAMERTAAAGRLHPLPLDNIDNAHDLLLQLLADVGVLGTLPVLAVAAAWGWRVLGPWRDGLAGAARRLALLPGLAVTAFIGAHSMLEYPLWYVYFLYAFAFALGWAEGAAQPTPAAATPTPALSRRNLPAVLAAAVMLALTVKASIDYARASDVYDDDEDVSLAARRDAMRDNWFFVPLAQFADAAATLPAPDASAAQLHAQLALLERASHAWGDPGLLSRRIVVLLRLGREDEALALARYTASAFWLYAPQTAENFGKLAAEAGVHDTAAVARVTQVLREAPVLRRIVVPRK